MSLSDPRWDDLSDAEWDSFAQAWVAEILGNKPSQLPDLPVLFPDDLETTATAFVTPMNFTASAASQWRFIESVFANGRDHDEALGHLAAGPVEHLLSKHGDDYIERIEAMARSDERFAYMLRQCYKHMMSKTVWDRICSVRSADK